MMSPYEGERIFEAEMVRLHQCDRTLYGCTEKLDAQSTAEASLLDWLTRRFSGRRTPEVSPTPSAASNNNQR